MTKPEFTPLSPKTTSITVEISNQEFSGDINVPLTIKRQEDGRYRATSTIIANKEWFGEDEQQAILYARRDIEEMHAKKDMVGNKPAWMTDKDYFKRSDD